MPTDASNLKVRNSATPLRTDSGEVIPAKKAGINSGERFRELYSAARARHEDLLALSETVLTGITNGLDRMETEFWSSAYVLVVTAAVVSTLIFFMPLIFWFFGLTKHSVEVVNLITSSAPKLHYLWHLLLVDCPVWLAIVAIIPLSFRLFPTLRERLNATRIPRYDGQHPYMRRMLFSVVYLETGAAMLWIAKLWIHASSFLSSLILIWAILPFAALLFFGTTRVAILSVLTITGRKLNSAQRLSLSLLGILERFDGMEDLSLLSAPNRGLLADSIVRASQRMAQLFERRPDPATGWARNQLCQAADNFLCLAVWIYLPKPGTLDELRAELVRYLNILLSGNLDELPRQDLPPGIALLVQKYRLRGWRKAVTYSAGAIYLVLPPFALGIVESFLSFQITAAAQAVLWLIYLVWVILGIPFFFDRISPEARDLASDLLRGLIGKK
jgi:hypothetical protein